MKQDLMLFVACCSLTSQIVTCHTRCFMNQAPGETQNMPYRKMRVSMLPVRSVKNEDGKVLKLIKK